MWQEVPLPSCPVIRPAPYTLGSRKVRNRRSPKSSYDPVVIGVGTHKGQHMAVMRQEVAITALPGSPPLSAKHLFAVSMMMLISHLARRRPSTTRGGPVRRTSLQVCDVIIGNYCQYTRAVSNGCNRIDKSHNDRCEPCCTRTPGDVGTAALSRVFLLSVHAGHPFGVLSLGFPH